ncbi:MAG: NAD(P)/FAD-dependent oxidoreductase [Methanomassiliicoccaceae archaeon]|jgi:digeranylgeranylglycerophospholipid reductase|nr:NAD(P)/FAD-dependent oxidoreductase [Methanomassiliicoccaceae archaeon]
MEAMRTDVLVVGAGPAGSVTARYAASKGVSVTLIERRRDIGVPVRCGEFVPSNEEIRGMFPRAADIDGLFDIPKELRLRDINAIRLVDPKMKASDIPFSGYTTDRDRFDKYLVSEAENAGATVITGCAFSRTEGGLARTSAGDIRYKVIVGADGPGSRVSRSLGLPRPEGAYPAVTAQARGEFDPVVVMFFGGIAPGAYSWIIPKRGQANVGVGFSPKFASGTLTEYFEKFVGKHNFDIINKLEGKYVPSQGPVSRTYTDSGMTVGDAAGHVISVNGGGIPLAMIAGSICGDVAADRVISGRPLEDYQKEWSRVMLKPLKTAARGKMLADIFAFGSDRRTGMCMKLLGKRRMGNLIRCKRIFP